MLAPSNEATPCEPPLCAYSQTCNGPAQTAATGSKLAPAALRPRPKQRAKPRSLKSKNRSTPERFFVLRCADKRTALWDRGPSSCCSALTTQQDRSSPCNHLSILQKPPQGGFLYVIHITNYGFYVLLVKSALPRSNPAPAQLNLLSPHSALALPEEYQETIRKPRH